MFTTLIHIVWFQGWTHAPKGLEDVPKRWEAMNHGSHVMVWDEFKMQAFVDTHYPQFSAAYHQLGSEAQTHPQYTPVERIKVPIIKKCDFIRILILYHFGGIYVDYDCIPTKPLKTLFESGEIHHRDTPFEYSRNCSVPTVLSKEDPHKVTVDFRRYSVLFCREHCPVRVVDPVTGNEVHSYPVANTVMAARPKFRPFLEFILWALQRKEREVLWFMGPWALTLFIHRHLAEFRNCTLMLPPYYFLWQPHDMGRTPWDRTLSMHLNRMDWVDKQSANGWKV
jgi:Glycosyltransferase sugar-binding region containing DXD motif